MTLIFEISNPPQWIPGLFRSASITRIYWLWFAVGMLRVPFREFAETAYVWSYRDRPLFNVARKAD